MRAVIFDMYETLVTLQQDKVFFSQQMAEMSGIPVEVFRPRWRALEHDRATGRLTFEQAAALVLREHEHCTQELLQRMTAERLAFQRLAFARLHPGIIPMLQQLKKDDIAIGLCSNCSSEEAAVIRASSLQPYFDSIALSWEIGVEKPDRRIFEACLSQLGLSPDECLYVGDGGSHELEAAAGLGMHPVQAAWYLKPGSGQPVGKLEGFNQAELPADVVSLCTKGRI